MSPSPARPPRPAAERATREKWAEPGAGARYAGSRFKTRRAALRDPALVERILDRHGVRPSLRPVLDAPCGTGRLRGVLERRGMRYVGLDVSLPMLREARRGEETDLVMAFVDRIPFRDDSFDVVVCCRLLHHIHDVEEAQSVVSELVRVAHRMVIVSFWDAASLHAWRARVGLRQPEGPPGRHAVRKRVLKRLFDAAGAEVVDFQHSFRFVSQQAFAVALKRAPVPEPAKAPAEPLADLLELSGGAATGSLG